MDQSIKDTRTNEEISDELKIKIIGTLSKHETLILSYEVDPENLDGCVSAITPELNPQGTYLMVVNSYVSSADTYFLGQEQIKRNQVETITIAYTNKVPSNATYSWDASEAQDKSIIAWYTDKDNNNLYELYIGGEGGVKANSDSKYLFSNFSNATTIDVNYLDTSEVSNMAEMFGSCDKLEKLNLSSFNTNNVTNMGSMFSGCSSLTNINFGTNFRTNKVWNISSMFVSCKNLIEIDLSSFNTSNVTLMNSMFNGCSSLTSIDVSNFNTSKISKLDYMFTNCSNLVNLDLSSFDTSKVTNVVWMFSGCEKLNSIDLSNATFTNITSHSYMFGNTSLNIPTNLKTIYVKDSVSKTFIEARLSERSITGVTVAIAA